jgi:hypothetical protein
MSHTVPTLVLAARLIYCRQNRQEANPSSRTSGLAACAAVAKVQLFTART